jgi:hypothetical protein
MTTPFPTVRPSQRIRNMARAMGLTSRGDYPTNADTLKEIAVVVAANEEQQARQAARIRELEAALNTQIEATEFRCPHCGATNPCEPDDVWLYCFPCDAFVDPEDVK